MGLILAPRRWHRQPTGRYRPAPDVAGIYLPTSRVDAVSGYPYDTSAYGAGVVGTEIAARFDGATAGIAMADGGWSDLVPSDAPIMFVCRFVRDRTTYLEWLFADYDSGGTTTGISFGVRFDISSTNARIRVRQGSSTKELTIPGVDIGEHTLVVGHIPGREVFYSLDGGDVVSSSTTVATRNSGTRARVGSGGDYSSQQLQGSVSLLAVLRADASAHARARALSRDPWSLLGRPALLVPTVDAAGSTHDLAATGSSTADGSATPSYDYALAAVGVTVTGGSAGQAADISVAAVGYTVTGGSAALSSSAIEDLGASGGAQSGGSAAPYANISIAASDLATAAGQAGLSAEWLMAGAGAAATAGNVDLAAQLNALAQGAAQTGGSAALDGGAAGELSAAGGSQSAGVAGLKIVATFVAQGSSQTAGAAALDGGATGDIAAAGSATTAGQAGVRLEASVTAVGFVQAMGAGYLVIQAPLEAIGGAATAGLATLEDAAAVLVLIKSPRFVVRASGRQFSVSAPGRTFKVSR